MGYAMLNIDPELKRLYSAEVRNKFEALQGLDSIEKQLENLRGRINKTAQKIIPKVKRYVKQKWMTEEILKLMEIGENLKETMRNMKQYIGR